MLSVKNYLKNEKIYLLAKTSELNKWKNLSFVFLSFVSMEVTDTELTAKHKEVSIIVNIDCNWNDWI